MIIIFMIGVMIGMIIMHFTKRNTESSAEASTVISGQPVIETVHKEEITNVYFPKRNVTSGHVIKNSYNTDNFKIDNGFMAYFDENGDKISHLGIDVSYHQSGINWEELKTSPVEFVMVRCGYRGFTEGGLIQDEKFEEFAKGANENGVALGIYFFTQAITVEEAVEEAEYVINLIDGYQISYPVAFDTELVTEANGRVNNADLSDEEMTKIAIAFCERIREAGYYPMIYASENWLRRKLDMTKLTQYDIWAPQYLDENDFLYDFTIWQYTDNGDIPGIKEKVDINISMVDYKEFVPAIREAMQTGGVISTYGENTVFPEE